MHVQRPLLALLVPWRSTDDLYHGQLGTTEEGIRKYQKTYYVAWRPEFDEYVQVPFRQTLSGEYPRLAGGDPQKEPQGLSSGAGIKGPSARRSPGSARRPA
jgi:hypothetical protein